MYVYVVKYHHTTNFTKGTIWTLVKIYGKWWSLGCKIFSSIVKPNNHLSLYFVS